jgi:2-dehydropantoate 2-reductase
MKVCIYGAGAIGGWIGMGLARAGCSVSVVARGATLQALQLHGLRLNQGGRITSQAVASSAQPAALGVQDVVVLAVKAPSLPEVARHIAPLLGPGTVVLTAMNGVPWWFLQGFGGPLAGKRLRSVDPTGEIAEAIPVKHRSTITSATSSSSASPQATKQPAWCSLRRCWKKPVSKPRCPTRSRKTSGSSSGAI